MSSVGQECQPQVEPVLIEKAIRRLDAAAALDEGRKLYNTNKEVYGRLRYGGRKTRCR